MSTDKPAISGDALSGHFASAFEYLVDTGQRNILFLDVMRQPGAQYRQHMAETAPHVLDYAIELIIAKADGAGVLPGARVPIVLTSRADLPRARMASCAVATLYADARRRRAQIAAA